jgi:3-hydroxyisobutyrate dehydrogenase
MKETIGFIGTGVMGSSMVQHLLKADYKVNIFTRTQSRAQTCLEAGATWMSSPAELASDSDVIITIVGYPSDVKEIYFGESGIIQHAKSKCTLIDMTTSQPQLAVDIYQAAKENGLSSLDAPVSGGDIGAQEARLSIMVGGDQDSFEKCKAIFEVMGKNIVYQGVAGSGQHTKMCNQIANASVMMGVCEALAYAKKSGLDPKIVLESISSGAAGSWALSNLAPRMIDENFDPGFYIKHFIKDMQIAIESAEKMDLKLPGLELAKSLYEKLAQQGYENEGTQALFRLYT